VFEVPGFCLPNYGDVNHHKLLYY